MIRRLWADPVWSKVIAQAIIGLFGLGVYAICKTQAIAICIVLVFSVEALLIWYRQRPARLIYGTGANYYHTPKTRNVLFWGMVATPVAGTLALGIALHPATSKLYGWFGRSQAFKIALARFENPTRPEDDKYRVTRYIAEGLLKLRDRHADIAILTLDDFIPWQGGRDQALRRAKKSRRSNDRLGRFR